MKKNKIILVLILLLVVMGVVVFLITGNKYENDLKVVELERSNQIYNRTNDKSLDTIYAKGLEILDIKGKNFIIIEMTDDVKTAFKPDIKLSGSVTQQINYFLIRTRLGSPKMLIDIASHELIHVKQMVDGNFAYEVDGVYYKGKFFAMPLTMDYHQLPWEIEAHKKGPELSKIMKDSLLKKK